jgi:dihydrofolate synthase/folylpolyglutamate synthase
MSELAALDWLFSFADLERGVGWNPRASADEQWKLGRTRTLLDLGGAPDRRLTCVLVAGTKGKGSTAAWLASVLDADGRRVGLYTQPHLQSYRERIRIGGLAISPDELADGVDRQRPLVHVLRSRFPEAGEPTTFELTTVLALDYFARHGAQVAVLEVGLGGRLDATNAVEPAVSIIASISRDHVAILGGTLGAIASEKAGILRAGRPGFLAEQRPAAEQVLAHRCREVGARCQTVPPLRLALARSPTGTCQRVVGPSLGEAWLPLVGAHQRQNAALAIAAAHALGVQSAATLRVGLERLRWPGRFELIDGEPPLVLDGAHNGDSAEALAATLLAYAGERPIQLVLGINRDKELGALLRPLLSLASGVSTTAVAGSHRARSAEELARLCRRWTPSGRRLAIHAWPTVTEALDAARAAAGPHGVVCVTGSLALVGQARTTLGLPVSERLWPPAAPVSPS